MNAGIGHTVMKVIMTMVFIQHRRCSQPVFPRPEYYRPAVSLTLTWLAEQIHYKVNSLSLSLFLYLASLSLSMSLFSFIHFSLLPLSFPLLSLFFYL